MPHESVLSLEQKQEVARKYQSGDFTQYDLATEYLVSRRTIQRALIEMGVKQYNTKKPRIVTEEEEQILTEVKKRGLKPDTLRRLFDAPSLTTGNVQLFLTRLEPEQFANLVSVVGYQRVKDNAIRNMNQTRKAANE